MSARKVMERKKAHARKRFMERYKIRLDDALSNKLIQRIQTPDRAERVCFVSHRASVWSVYIEAEHIPGATEGMMIPVVYDKDRKLIATVLPLECKELGNIDMHAIDSELDA